MVTIITAIVNISSPRQAKIINGLPRKQQRDCRCAIDLSLRPSSQGLIRKLETHHNQHCGCNTLRTKIPKSIVDGRLTHVSLWCLILPSFKLLIEGFDPYRLELDTRPTEILGAKNATAISKQSLFSAKSLIARRKQGNHPSQSYNLNKIPWSN